MGVCPASRCMRVWGSFENIVKTRRSTGRERLVEITRTKGGGEILLSKGCNTEVAVRVETVVSDWTTPSPLRRHPDKRSLAKVGHLYYVPHKPCPKQQRRTSSHSAVLSPFPRRKSRPERTLFYINTHPMSRGCQRICYLLDRAL